MFETLNTERLHLRPIRESDAMIIFEKWCQDPDISKYMTWEPHKSISETKAFISFCLKGRSSDHFTWIIEELSSGEIIGCFDATVNGHKIDVGYLIIKSHWGAGFMSEALKAFISEAFKDECVFRVSAVCDVDNLGSKKVMEKSGMFYEGVLKSWLIHPNMAKAPRDCHSLCVIKTP